MEMIMRMSIIKMIVVLFSYALMFIQSSDAYDNVYTHPYINEKAVKEHSKVNTILKESVGLNEGIDAIYLDKEKERPGRPMVPILALSIPLSMLSKSESNDL
jgi:hypothetical protein